MKRILILILFSFLYSASLQAQFSSILSVDYLPIESGGTQDKAQSKVFQMDGKHWAVLPTSTGTNLFRLDGSRWTQVMRITTRKGRADCKVVGNVVHVFVYQKTTSQLISIEYVPATASFKPWSTRSSIVDFPFNETIKTGTIEVDSRNRMWLTFVRSGGVHVQWSDVPYTNWSSPVTIATGMRDDDGAAIIAMPGKIGVLWSNQITRRWGFKTHIDGTDPNNWTSDEVPASQSALNVGYGMADDHMNMKVASDGTLYCAVKTSYNNSSYPLIGLLVRRPNGSWDILHDVSHVGTTPIVMLNEEVGKLRVVYSTKTYGGDIVYHESPLGTIAIGPQRTLMAGGALRDPSTSKQNMGKDALVIFADASATAVTGKIVQDQQTTTPVPVAPALVSPANNTQQVSLSTSLVWQSVAHASAYQLQVASDANFTNLFFNQQIGNVTSHQLSGLAYSSTYYWRVRASNSSGISAWSAAWQFKTLDPPAGPVAQLVGHWRMEEGGGKVLQDASGLNNHATLLNPSDVRWVSGMDGLSIELPGTLRRYGEVQSNASLNIAEAITISAWVRPSTLKGRIVLSKVVPDGYQFGTNGSGKMEFWFNQESGGTTYRLYSNASINSTGQVWTHVAATFDGRTAKIYINGVEDNSITYARAVKIGTNSSTLIIGSREGNNRWSGGLDDVRLYSGALSAEEIKSLVNVSAMAKSINVLAFSNELDAQEQGNLSVYPNPMQKSGIIRFSLNKADEYTLLLYDSKGAMLRYITQGHAAQETEQQVALDMAGLGRGLYLIRLETKTGTVQSCKLLVN